jgi:hypothetical protein
LSTQIRNRTPPQIDGKPLQQVGITPLQRILVLQALRPDRLLSALEKLVVTTFQNPQTLSLGELMTSERESTFVFTVTSGSDSSIELREIALELPAVADVNSIEFALGECDSKDALSLVRR